MNTRTHGLVSWIGVMYWHHPDSVVLNIVALWLLGYSLIQHYLTMRSWFVVPVNNYKLEHSESTLPPPRHVWFFKKNDSIISKWENPDLWYTLYRSSDPDHPQNLIFSRATSDPKNAPRFLVLEESTRTRLITYQINCIIFWHIIPYKMLKIEIFNYVSVAFISYKLTMWDRMPFSDGRKASRPTSKKTRHL